MPNDVSKDRVDLVQKKRVQNRVAQRKYRKPLENRVIHCKTISHIVHRLSREGSNVRTREAS